MKASRLKLTLAGLILIGFSFVSGAAFVEKQIPPYRTLQQYWDRLLSRIGLSEEDGADDRTVSTTLLDLKLHSVRIPVVRRHWGGGGLTSVGDELLLLTYDGRILTVTGQGATLTGVTPPDNGFAAYKKGVDEGRFPNVRHYPESVRYHQIKAYTAGATSYLVISYTEWRDKDACYGNAVARLPLKRTPISAANATPGDWAIVYRSQPCLTLEAGSDIGLEGFPAGGAMAYISDHKFLLTNGDFEWDGVHRKRALAQALDNDYGKVLELDVETGAGRIVARGIRNAQGIVIRKTGEVFTVEHGQRGGDELNRIVEGADYGYPQATLGVLYSGEPWPLSPEVGRHSRFTPPVYAWLPSVAPSTLIEIHGFDPSWDGDLLVATLLNKTLYRLRIEQGRVMFAEPIPIGSRIRAVHQHTDGRIILWTDNEKVVFISRIGVGAYKAVVDQALGALPASERSHVRAAFDRCLQCHSLNPNGTEAAPGLAIAYGRKIADSRYSGYSPALRQRSGTWTASNLKAFMIDPGAFARGSTMPAGTLMPADADGVIAILKALATVKE